VQLLADENVPGVAVAALRKAGHDVVWIRTDAPGSSDERILERALADGRLLLTFDKDFGELVFRRGLAASRGIILFRLPVLSPEETATIVAYSLALRDDWEGHFSVVEPGHLRMRAMPQ